MDQDPIVDKAISGLKANLKDELARCGARPETLSKLIQFVIPLDNRLYEREIERKNKDKNGGYQDKVRSNQGNTGVTVNAYVAPGSAPNLAVSQLQLTNNGSIPPSPPYVRGQPISNKLRQYWRDFNLCMRCGGGGHRAFECKRGRPETNVKIETTGQIPAGKAQGP